MSSLALIELQQHKLALPHHHIFAIERCSRTQSIVRMGGGQWDAMDLDDELQWRAQADYPAPFVVCFKRWAVALRCARVDSIAADNVIPLPRIMQSPTSVVQGFIQHERGLVLVLDVDALLNSCGFNGDEQCSVMPGVSA